MIKPPADPKGSAGGLCYLTSCKSQIVAIPKADVRERPLHKIKFSV